MTSKIESDIDEEEVKSKINELVALYGTEPTSYQGELVSQIIQNGLKLLINGHDTGQIKLMTRALKEMRYAYRIFNKHRSEKRIGIFGSARTPEDHPDYLAAKEFSSLMASNGWTCMTGAANGIMKAGLEGLPPEIAFGLSIRLPFESTVNSVIEGDPKLITFRYFFTRKLMFMSHSDAVAVFPGGVGTQDELFEFLTLMQTGKGNIIPIVLIEGQPGVYWKKWEEYMQENLLKNGWISPADTSFYFHAPSIEAACEHVKQFYVRYHSSRYVGDVFVIRMRSKLSSEQLKTLNKKFSILVKSGEITQGSHLPEESDHLELPRLHFEHTRQNFGILRQMIDHINAI